MRKVKVLKYIRKDGDTYYEKIDDGKGDAFFHGFSVDFEEFETGPGTFPVAIIERKEGNVEIVAAELIKFI